MKEARLSAGLRSDPTGIRTRVFAVRGRCPWPLDDGALPLSRREFIAFRGNGCWFTGHRIRGLTPTVTPTPDHERKGGRSWRKRTPTETAAGPARDRTGAGRLAIGQAESGAAF